MAKWTKKSLLLAASIPTASAIAAIHSSVRAKTASRKSIRTKCKPWRRSR